MAEKTSSSRTALVVGGDVASRALLDDLLRRLGYAVVTARDGTDARAALGRGPVEVVILDLPLAGPNALEFLDQVRHSLHGPPVVVIGAGKNGDPGTEAVAPVLERLLRGPPPEPGPPRDDLEARLGLCQQMTLVGQVAGGVAHDLNNLVTVLLGFSAYHLERLPHDNPLRESAQEIHRAAIQAARLTRRLLNLSRPAPAALVPVNLNALLLELEKILASLLPPGVILMTDLEPRLGLTEAEPGRLEQVALNLVLNARDAMPQGGRLTVTTANHTAGPADPDLPPGAYVTLTVSDTGIGMDAATRERIFEPFFTTKPAERGTGLGLAVVAEVVRECGGAIRVTSEPGRGARFTVLLPRLPELPPLGTEAEDAAVGPPAEAQGTVLVVEDNEGVRTLIDTVLRGAGYRVLAAHRGTEALELVRAYSGRIDLLITDLVLPQMSGQQVAETIVPLQPGLKVLFISGYLASEPLPAAAAAGGGNFLQKPFSAQILLGKVRKLLEEGNGEG
jgi:two-component system cell cycle sensor histidine kinase/response regulator CckA